MRVGRRYRGRHRRERPLIHRALVPLLALLVTGAAVAPDVLTEDPPVAAALALPSRAPDVPPVPAVVTPTRLGGDPAPRTTSPTAAPTTSPPPTTTAPAPSTPPAPAPSCGDHADGPAAQSALDGDERLAEYLDSDGDGQACERRFPRTPVETPETTTAGRDQPAVVVSPPTSASPQVRATARSCPSELEGTRPHVAQAGHHLLGRFAVSSVGGRAGRSRTSDHPSGHALDFMVDRATGDELAAYALEQRAELAVKYVIWRQRINHGSGWKPMEDRGGVTTNHFDHAHISFETAPGPGLPC